MKDIPNTIGAWLALLLVPIGVLTISWGATCFILWLISKILGMYFFLDLATVVWVLLVFMFLCIGVIIKIDKRFKD